MRLHCFLFANIYHPVILADRICMWRECMRGRKALQEGWTTLSLSRFLGSQASCGIHAPWAVWLSRGVPHPIREASVTMAALRMGGQKGVPTMALVRLDYQARGAPTPEGMVTLELMQSLISC